MPLWHPTAACPQLVPRLVIPEHADFLDATWALELIATTFIHRHCLLGSDAKEAEERKAEVFEAIVMNAHVVLDVDAEIDLQAKRAAEAQGGAPNAYQALPEAADIRSFIGVGHADEWAAQYDEADVGVLPAIAEAIAEVAFFVLERLVTHHAHGIDHPALVDACEAERKAEVEEPAAARDSTMGAGICGEQVTLAGARLRAFQAVRTASAAQGRFEAPHAFS